MTPDNDKQAYRGRAPGERRSIAKKSPVSRVKMLLAAGAVAGTLSGWTLLAHEGNEPVVQSAARPTATVLVTQMATATSTTMQQDGATPLAGTSTPTIQATPLTAQATATPTSAEPTATFTPVATATTVKQAATPTPITTTRSSR